MKRRLGDMKQLVTLTDILKYPECSEWSGKKKYEGEWREGKEQPEKEERPNSSLLI